MSSPKSALLIGNIAHARKEWEECGSLLQLKVGKAVQALPCKFSLL